MIKNVLTILFIIYILYAIFMATPFGAMLIWDELDNDKPCYSIIIHFILSVPMVIIGCYLGIIK